MPGVEGVGYYNWFGGYYQDPRNQISVGAIGRRSATLELFPEIELPDGARWTRCARRATAR